MLKFKKLFISSWYLHTSVFLQSGINKTINCAHKHWYKILYNKNTYRSRELYVYLSKRKCPAPQSNVSPLVLLLDIRMMPKSESELLISAAAAFQLHYITKNVLIPWSLCYQFLQEFSSSLVWGFFQPVMQSTSTVFFHNVPQYFKEVQYIPSVKLGSNTLRASITEWHKIMCVKRTSGIADSSNWLCNSKMHCRTLQGISHCMRNKLRAQTVSSTPSRA